MDQWYYLDGDRRVGPFDLDAIRQLLRAGVVGEDSLVARVGDAEWMPAASLVVEEAAEPRTPSRTSATRADVSPSFAVGPLKPLGLATGAFVGFFAIQLLLLRSFFGRTNIDPRMGFAWERAFASLAIPVAVLVLLALAIATMDWLRRKRILDGKKPVGLIWTLVVLWLVAAGVCKWANDGPAHATAALKLTAMFMQGAGGSAVLYLAALALALIAGLAVAGSLAARRVIKRAATARALPPVPILVAGVVARIVVVLALFSVMFSAFVAVTKWPPKVNTDRRTIDLIVRAVEDYTASEKESPGKAWYELLRRAPRTEQQTWLGDSWGLIDDNLIGLLGNHLDESLRNRGEILDTWGQPVRVAFDGDGDGIINIDVERRPHGRLIVWTIGWNGVDEGGGGDDVMVIRSGS